MAALTQDQVTRVWSDSGARVWSLFEVKDISGGDNADLAALGFYRIVKQAVWMGATASATAAAPITAPATVAALGPMNHEAAYLLVDGVPL
jgi:hypothetical protein